MQYDSHLQNEFRFFVKKLFEYISSFMGVTGTPIMHHKWRLKWVSEPGWVPSLVWSSPVHVGFLNFISGATSANFLVFRLCEGTSGEK